MGVSSTVVGVSVGSFIVVVGCPSSGGNVVVANAPSALLVVVGEPESLQAATMQAKQSAMARVTKRDRRRLTKRILSLPH